jgi:dimethylamine monooxygenase subunit C
VLITGIKSRPVYTTLRPNPSGRCHVLIGQGSGGESLLRLLGELPAGGDVRVLYARASASGRDLSERLLAFGVPGCRVFGTQVEAIAELDRLLARCVMGTRLYVAGSESFIGSVAQVATRYNLNADEVQSEHRGTAARRVYCVHCHASNENVTTNVVRCGGCDRHLLVRDHYSRRLAAYMGVMADAEVPGELPPIRENFS